MNNNGLSGDRVVGLAPASILYLLWLLVAIALSFGAMALDTARDGVGFLTAVYSIIVLTHLGRMFQRDSQMDWLAPDLVFLLAYSVFHYFYVSGYAIGLLPSIALIAHYPDLMPYTLFLVNLGLIFFLGGYEVALTGNRAMAIMETPRYVVIPLFAWYFIAWIAMGVALVFHFGTLVQVPFTSLISDPYGVVSHMGDYVPHPRFFIISDRIFLVGAAIYIVTSIFRTGKLFAGKFAMVVIFGMMFVYALEGNRGNLMQLVIVVLCCRHYGLKRIRLRWVMMIGLATFFVIGAVRLLRHVPLKVTALPSEYQYQKERAEVPVSVTTFAELGGTVNTVNATVGIIKQGGEDYWLGRSLAQAFVGTISRGITAKTKMVIAPSVWLTFQLKGGGRTTGVGYSILAEGYLNFGIPGVFLVMFGVGYILRRLYVRWIASRTPFNLIMVLVGLACAAFWVRQVAELAIPTFMRALIIYGLLRLLLPPKYVPASEHGQLSADYPHEDMLTE